MNKAQIEAAKVKFIQTMKWSADATEDEKTLVLGNLNGFVAFLAQQPRTIKIRSFEFQHGLLHLKIKDCLGLTDQEVAEKYGHGKGELKQAWNDRMGLKEFNALEDFQEL